MSFDQFSMVYLGLGMAWAVLGSYRVFRAFSGKGLSKAMSDKLEGIKREAEDLLQMGLPAWVPAVALTIVWAGVTILAVFAWPLFLLVRVKRGGQ